MFDSLLKALSDLEKAAQHKYTHKKRVGTDKKGRPQWRYFYNVRHGGGIGGAALEVKGGEAFQLTNAGQRGHFHVQRVKGNRVTVRHDETGHEVTMSKRELQALLMQEHGEKFKREKKKPAKAKREKKKPAREQSTRGADNFETMPESESQPEPTKTPAQSAREALKREVEEITPDPRSALDEEIARIGEERKKRIRSAKGKTTRYNKLRDEYGEEAEDIIAELYQEDVIDLDTRNELEDIIESDIDDEGFLALYKKQRARSTIIDDKEREYFTPAEAERFKITKDTPKQKTRDGNVSVYPFPELREKGWGIGFDPERGIVAFVTRGIAEGRTIVLRPTAKDTAPSDMVMILNRLKSTFTMREQNAMFADFDMNQPFAHFNSAERLMSLSRQLKELEILSKIEINSVSDLDDERERITEELSTLDLGEEWTASVMQNVEYLTDSIAASIEENVVSVFHPYDIKQGIDALETMDKDSKAGTIFKYAKELTAAEQVEGDRWERVQARDKIMEDIVRRARNVFPPPKPKRKKRGRR